MYPDPTLDLVVIIMADGNTDLYLGAGIILAFGALAGAILKLFQLADRVKKDGAWKQKMQDDNEALKVEIGNLSKEFRKEIGALREDMFRNKEIDQKLFTKIDHLEEVIVKAQKHGVEERAVLKDMIHESQMTSTKEHATLSVRLATLEASGCKPAKEKAS